MRAMLKGTSMPYVESYQTPNYKETLSLSAKALWVASENEKQTKHSFLMFKVSSSVNINMPAFPFMSQ